MPRGLRRFHDSGQSHFVTFSCYRRQPNFVSAAVYDLFPLCLEEMRPGAPPKLLVLGWDSFVIFMRRVAHHNIMPGRPVLAVFWLGRGFSFVS